MDGDVLGIAVNHQRSYIMLSFPGYQIKIAEQAMDQDLQRICVLEILPTEVLILARGTVEVYENKFVLKHLFKMINPFLFQDL